mgnify:CR=1 FL=1
MRTNGVLLKLNLIKITDMKYTEEKIPEIIHNYNVDALFYNRDYEPYAQTRDEHIHQNIKIPYHTYKDSVIFEKDDQDTRIKHVFLNKNKCIKFANKNRMFISVK